MRYSKSRDRRGDTLIEVVFALAILAIILTVMTTAAVGAWRTSRLAGERTQAAAYAQEQAEALKAFHRGVEPAVFDSTFVALYPNTLTPNTLTCMVVDSGGWRPRAIGAGSGCQVGAYSREITSVTALSPSGLYEVRIRVTWKSIGSGAANSTDQVVTIGRDS